MDEGYVYLVVEVNQKGEEKYKIGITKNDPIDRIKKLKTGNSGELSLLNKYKSKNYRKIEKWLHRKYKYKRTISQNEFFGLPDDDVFNFLSDCKEIDSNINFMRENNPFFK